MNPQEPQKKNNSTLIIVLVLVIGACALCIPIGAAILFPVFAQAKEAAKRTASLSNVKQLSLAAIMYSQDFDDRFPNAKNWGDDLEPYLKNPNVWRSPNGDEKVEDRYDYAMIAARGGQKMPPVLEAPTTPLLFESGSGERNQSGHFELIPDPPRYKKNGQPQALVAYTDGGAAFVFYEALGLKN